MGGKRNITSPDSTMMFKVVLPVLFSLVGLICTVVGLLNIRGDLWFLSIFWPVITAWVLWFASRLKWVSVDEGSIYAAGFRREIQIPLSEVNSVEASYMQRPKQITLWLKSPSEFGRKIVFVPQQRLFESMREGHPLVEELEAMVKAHAEGYKSSRT
jgi:hypothetical protein